MSRILGEDRVPVRKGAVPFGKLQSLPRDGQLQSLPRLCWDCLKFLGPPGSLGKKRPAMPGAGVGVGGGGVE